MQGCAGRSGRGDRRAAAAAQRDIDLAVRFVFARPGIFLNTASDIDLLAKILDAADRGGPAPALEEMNDLIRRREMAPLFA